MTQEQPSLSNWGWYRRGRSHVLHGFTRMEPAACRFSRDACLKYRTSTTSTSPDASPIISLADHRPLVPPHKPRHNSHSNSKPCVDHISVVFEKVIPCNLGPSAPITLSVRNCRLCRIRSTAALLTRTRSEYSAPQRVRSAMQRQGTFHALTCSVDVDPWNQSDTG